MPVAATLDQGIAEADSVIAVLRAVARALTSTQFVDYVIARRSTAPLLVASRLLGQLPGDGYGFTDDFRIIDRRTRTGRAVKTLSGGATFLASLALASGSSNSPRPYPGKQTAEIHDYHDARTGVLAHMAFVRPTVPASSRCDVE